MKRCSRCKQLKPISAFSKDRCRKDGLRCYCKTCQSSYYVDHRDKIVAQHTAYNVSHKAESAEWHAAYYATHRDEVCAHSAAHYAANRDKKAVYGASYYALHKDEINARHGAWRRDNPSKERAICHRRRARKLAAGGTHTATDINRQGEVQEWRCWWCGDDCKDKYHVDHLVPLARGGHNGPGNIVIACPHCNMSKQDKLPDEFAGKLL